jgi:membrane dipeptidase
VNALVANSIVWDNHACLPLRPHDDRFLPQLERFRSSGVTVVSINVGFDICTIEAHIRLLAHFRRWIRDHPEQFLLVERIADIQRAKDSRRLGVFFDIEGLNAIDEQLSLIELYYDLGVRWMLVAYNRPNRAGGGCLEPDLGLTELGARQSTRWRASA